MGPVGQVRTYSKAPKPQTEEERRKHIKKRVIVPKFDELFIKRDENKPDPFDSLDDFEPQTFVAKTKKKQKKPAGKSKKPLGENTALLNSSGMSPNLHPNDTFDEVFGIVEVPQAGKTTIPTCDPPSNKPVRSNKPIGRDHASPLLYQSLLSSRPSVSSRPSWSNTDSDQSGVIGQGKVNPEVTQPNACQSPDLFTSFGALRLERDDKADEEGGKRLEKSKKNGQAKASGRQTAKVTGTKGKRAEPVKTGGGKSLPVRKDNVRDLSTASPNPVELVRKSYVKLHRLPEFSSPTFVPHARKNVCGMNKHMTSTPADVKHRIPLISKSAIGATPNFSPVPNNSNLIGLSTSSMFESPMSFRSRSPVGLVQETASASSPSGGSKYETCHSQIKCLNSGAEAPVKELSHNTHARKDITATKKDPVLPVYNWDKDDSMSFTDTDNLFEMLITRKKTFRHSKIVPKIDSSGDFSALERSLITQQANKFTLRPKCIASRLSTKKSFVEPSPVRERLRRKAHKTLEECITETYSRKSVKERENSRSQCKVDTTHTDSFVIPRKPKPQRVVQKECFEVNAEEEKVDKETKSTDADESDSLASDKLVLALSQESSCVSKNSRLCYVGNKENLSKMDSLNSVCSDIFTNFHRRRGRREDKLVYQKLNLSLDLFADSGTEQENAADLNKTPDTEQENAVDLNKTPDTEQENAVDLNKTPDTEQEIAVDLNKSPDQQVAQAMEKYPSIDPTKSLVVALERLPSLSSHYQSSCSATSTEEDQQASPTIEKSPSIDPTKTLVVALERLPSLSSHYQSSCSATSTVEDEDMDVEYLKVMPIAPTKRGKGWRRSCHSMALAKAPFAGEDPDVRRHTARFSRFSTAHGRADVSRMSALPPDLCRQIQKLTLTTKECLNSTYSSFHTVVPTDDTKTTGEPDDPREHVLMLCSQEDQVPIEECFSDSRLSNCKKIGEGVYGEVFMTKPDPKSMEGATVLKIMPIEGSFEVNGEPQKKFGEILSEIVISLELSNLRKDENGDNWTENYVSVLSVWCVEGSYTKDMLQLWDKFNEEKGSENDRPDIFPDTQLYIALEFGFGGSDLESYIFNNAGASLAIFLQIAYTLAVAEQELEFEHRDLHWGNVLIVPTKETSIDFKVAGVSHTLQTKGVKATIIDFTLSRLRLKHCVMYYNLGEDPSLFTSQGDYQFEIYRLMKKANGNDWEKFTPYTNVLWLHYTLDKMISECYYKNVKAKVHTANLKELRRLKDQMLDYQSASDFVDNWKSN